MKKYLYISNGTKSEDYYSKESITLNNMRKCCIEPALKMGYEVYMSQNRKYIDEIKVNDYDVKMYDANIYRSIFNFKDNFRAYRQLDKFLDSHNIDVIHCNTPIGGVLGRICGSKHHVKKIIYTAHGFHFYKGNNPVKNLIFRTIERYLARKTDAIITINQEDYEAARKFKLKKGGKVFFTDGVGINLDEFKKNKNNKTKKRIKLGIKKEDIVLISTGDLVNNKNYKLALDIIAKINDRRIQYLICGEGPNLKKLQHKSKKLGIENQIHFLGYRTDIKELLEISDIFLFTTKREGLSRSLMEAIAVGLPCVVSDIRGNRDLIQSTQSGYCCKKKSEYVQSINNIIKTQNVREHRKRDSIELLKEYDYKNIVKEMTEIYNRIGI